ncbi:unnamed protein product [Oikopleura dioica]|uniref:Uncharacterized protein n=1 Tax=Oikopleura dioica TaxID=34765 RepID=E4XDD6_OIKDI|nr:unnamed protein product [Oikopleura dioica]
MNQAPEVSSLASTSEFQFVAPLPVNGVLSRGQSTRTLSRELLDPLSRSCQSIVQNQVQPVAHGTPTLPRPQQVTNGPPQSGTPVTSSAAMFGFGNGQQDYVPLQSMPGMPGFHSHPTATMHQAHHHPHGNPLIAKKKFSRKVTSGCKVFTCNPCLAFIFGALCSVLIYMIVAAFTSCLPDFHRAQAFTSGGNLVEPVHVANARNRRDADYDKPWRRELGEPWNHERSYDSDKCAVEPWFAQQLATASGRLGQKNALSLEEWKDLCIQNLDAHLQMCENHILTVWTITHACETDLPSSLWHVGPLLASDVGPNDWPRALDGTTDEQVQVEGIPVDLEDNPLFVVDKPLENKSYSGFQMRQSVKFSYESIYEVEIEGPSTFVASGSGDETEFYDDNEPGDAIEFGSSDEFASGDKPGIANDF